MLHGKKWQTPAEAQIDDRTMVAVCFLCSVLFYWKKQQSDPEDFFAQHQQVHQIQEKVMDVMSREVQTVI